MILKFKNNTMIVELANGLEYLFLVISEKVAGGDELK